MKTWQPPTRLPAQESEIRRFANPHSYQPLQFDQPVLRRGLSSAHPSALNSLGTHGRGCRDGSDRASDWTKNAIVLGSVKHAPLTRRPSALLDLSCARWPWRRLVGTAGSVAFRSNRRIAHAARRRFDTAVCRARYSRGPRKPSRARGASSCYSECRADLIRHVADNGQLPYRHRNDIQWPRQQIRRLT